MIYRSSQRLSKLSSAGGTIILGFKQLKYCVPGYIRRIGISIPLSASYVTGFNFIRIVLLPAATMFFIPPGIV